MKYTVRVYPYSIRKQYKTLKEARLAIRAYKKRQKKDTYIFRNSDNKRMD